MLQLTAAKYEGQTDTVGLYKIGEIAEQLGISARRLNEFLKDCRIQYKPNGSPTWRLYSEYLNENIALPRIVTLENGYDLPILMWTAKGRDFIFDLAEREIAVLTRLFKKTDTSSIPSLVKAVAYVKRSVR